jgi:acyl transferase domain-containing protein/NADPH:quinone reductase-like Zn-dependent oxidoreductase
MLNNMGMLSPDSTSFSFDHRANGYGRGEGIAALILKRLPDALRDGDTIRGVIRSTAVNHDGRTPGATQPNKESQSKLIRDTYAKAGLSMRPTRYFEAHGTGTPVGDPIEASAIGEAFSHDLSQEDPLYIGSIKANIGHTEGASGLASVIKSILILERGLIPPVANFEQLNPRIDAAELKIRVPSNLVAWPSDGLRRISVNSFGASGTNAHVVLDDAYHYLKERGLQGYHVTRKTPPRLHQLSTEDEATEDQLASNSDSGYGTPESVCGELKTPRLLIFSAPDKPALQRIAELYDHWSAKYSPALKNTPEVLERLAYTLAERRSLFTYRSFAVVDDPGELRDIKSQLRSVTRAINQPRMCFVFTGQGAQWSGMGMELLRFPIFRNSVRDADAYLKSIGSEWSSLDALCDSDDAASIHRPIFSQTLCTVLQVGLVDLCRSLGLHPAAVVGHSSGEIGAAYCAGAISKSSALKLAYFRGVVAERESKRSCGGMMAVGMSHKGIAALLAEMPDRCPTLAVACINSPENVTISGPRTELEALDIALEKRDVFHRRLKVDVAYHSSGLQVAAAEYEEYVGSLEPGDGGWPTAIMVSSVSGDIANAQDLRTVCYWVQNMLQPVRFCDALTLLCGASGVVKSPTPRLNMLIEVGPHGALQGPIRDTLKVQPGVDGITYHSAMRRFTPGDHSFLSLLGQVWSHGVELDLSLANSLDREQVDRRKRVMTDLPEYPFDHSRTYLHTGRLGKEFRFRRNIKHDLLGKPVLDWNPLEPRWRNFLKLSQLPWARDHKINGAVIYPAVGMLVMAIEAANQLADQNRPVKGIKLTDCVFSTALTIPTDAAGIETQLTLRPLRGDSDRTSLSWEFRVCSCKDGQWQEHSHGKVHLDLDSPEEAHQAERLKQAQDAHRRVEASARLRRSKDEFYDSAFKSGYTFGPTFRAMEDLIFSDESGPQTIANVRPFIWEEVDGANYFQPHIVHPTTLDGILQISLASFSRAGEDVVPTAIPTEIEYLWISTSGLSYLDNDVVQTRGTFIHKGLIGYETAVTALDKSSTRIVLEARGIKLRFVTGSSAVEQQARDDHQCYTLQWKPDPDLLDPRILEDVDTGVRIGVLDQHQAKLHKVLVAYLDLSTFKRPDMEILHIINPEERALGTLLHQLLATAERADSILPCAKFTSKDLNPDVADLPTEESEFIYPEAYDLIILSCTRNSIDLVPSIQRLLKAGGKVIVAANEESAVCRNLTTHSEVGDVWSETLESNGFSDTTVLYENSIDDATLIVSSKAAQGSSADAEPMRYRVVLESTPYQEEFALSLKVAFQKAGLVCDTRHIDDIEVELDSSEVVYIFLSELEGPFLEGISKENFMRLRHILVASRRLLWLTGRAEGGLPSPSRAMCEGLTRVLRVENENSVIVTASLEKEYISALVHDVLHLAKATELSTSHGYEVAYRKVGGHFQISRLTVAKDTTQLMAAKAVPFQSKIQPFGAGPPLRMAIETPGLLDSLHFVEDQSVAEPLAPDEVEIKVAMVGLNFKDLLLALGRENGTTFGNECAGIISRAGAATSFTPGDRVCTFTATAFSSLTRVKAERVARIPDSITLAHAAAVPTQFATCWHALYEIGNLKKDESILIHSAAGGTGQVAIQMAKLIGAEIFATVGSDEKKRFLVEHYGISEDHVFNSRSSAFADGILQMTNGYGIDVILNSLSGDSLLASWNLIAPYGRFIELGKKDILANTNLPMRPFSRRATFSAIETGTMSAEFGAKGRDIIERILRMLADGILQPVKNFDVLPISQVQEGMRMLQAGNYYGKIVFDMADDAQVPVSNNRSQQQFSANLSNRPESRPHRNGALTQVKHM